MNLHQSKIQTRGDNKDYHYQGKDCIEIIRNRRKKQLKSSDTRIIRHIGIHRSCPAGNRCYDADWCCCSINNVCQLCSGYLIAVCDRPHNRTDGQTVKIIIHKDQHSKACSCQHRTLFGFDLASGPFSIGC